MHRLLLELLLGLLLGPLLLGLLLLGLLQGILLGLLLALLLGLGLLLLGRSDQSPDERRGQRLSTAGVEHRDVNKTNVGTRARRPVPKVRDLNGKTRDTEGNLANPDPAVSASLNPKEGAPVNIKAHFPKNAKRAVSGVAPDGELIAIEGAQVKGGEKGTRPPSGDKLRP